MASVRNALFAVMRKELRQTLRDRRMAAMLIAAPVLQLTLLGYAVDLDVDRIPTVVCDQDRSAESRALAAGLLADGTLEQTYAAQDPEALLLEGWVQAAVVLPRGLARDLKAGRPARVQVLVDGTDPIRAQVALNAALQQLQLQSLDLARERMVRAAASQGLPLRLPGIQVEPRVLYNPQMRSPVYMVPGVVALVLLIVTTVITAMGIARERELGTIEQLLVTPLRPFVLLLGKTLPFAGIGLLVAGLVLAVGTHLFDVPVRGSLLALLVGTILYLMSTLGMGVFISTVARTQQQAILGSFFFLMPAILLSGFMTPIESMPGWIQPLTLLNPVRYFVEILRACLLKGASLQDLGQQVLALLAFGTLILTLAALRFRKRLA